MLLKYITLLQLLGDGVSCVLLDSDHRIDKMDLNCVYNAPTKLFLTPPLLLKCRMIRPFHFSEEDWRRIIAGKGSEWKVQLLTTAPADEFTVRLLRVGNPRIKDDQDTDILDILRFIDNPGFNKPSGGLHKLEEELFYAATLEESLKIPSQVIIHLDNSEHSEEDLDALYSRFPSSPPGPVKVGSLLVSPWKGNLFRAKENNLNLIILS